LPGTKNWRSKLQ